MATATTLTGIRVYWFMRAEVTDLSNDDGHMDGVLTCDHPQSCHGQPVLVADDGTVYGPGDLPAHVTLSAHGGYGVTPIEEPYDPAAHQAASRGLKAAAIMAGYRLA